MPASSERVSSHIPTNSCIMQGYFNDRVCCVVQLCLGGCKAVGFNTCSQWKLLLRLSCTNHHTVSVREPSNEVDICLIDVLAGVHRVNGGQEFCCLLP